MKDNWCPEIYRGLFVDRRNNGVLIAPCCQATGAVEPTDTFDFSTSNHLTNLRNEFTLGNKPSACDRCWKNEEIGLKSRRQSAIKFYNVAPSDEVVLQGLDFSATWACNCACIMCGPWQSSLWAKELSGDEFDKAKFRYNKVIDRVDLSNLQKLHLNGGEPMLSDDHLKILSKVDLSKLFVSYNTNGTIYPTQATIDLWKQTKLVKLFFSIDAVGNAYEYIRWPANWENVKNNMLKMKEELPSNVMFGFNITVACYNIPELADVINWINQNIKTNKEGDKSDINIQIAHNFDPLALPMHVREKLLPTIDVEELSEIRRYLLTPGHKQLNWIENLN